MSTTKYVTIRISKRILAATGATLFAGVLSLNYFGQAAQALQPQPAGTSFKWASVSADTDRYSRVENISYDGRYVLFQSSSPLLVVGDTNNVADYFIRDTQTNTLKRVNVLNDGSQIAATGKTVMSPNGRYVAFSTPINNVYQVMVRDTVNGTTKIVSVNAQGATSNASVDPASISDTGKVLMRLDTASSNLVANYNSSVNDLILGSVNGDPVTQAPFVDPNGGTHVWNTISEGVLSADGSTLAVMAYDTTSGYHTGSNQPISQAVAINITANSAKMITPAPAHAWNYYMFNLAGLSRNGNFALFDTNDNTLQSNSAGASLYKTDLNTNTVTPVDMLPSGRQRNGATARGLEAISDDGRYVGYMSNATTLDQTTNPTPQTDQNGYVSHASFYIADTQSNTSRMVANQVATNDLAYAAGASRFAFATDLSLNEADPDGYDVYTAQ